MSDIHALPTLMYDTAFCCPPYFFVWIYAPVYTVFVHEAPGG